MLADGRVLAAGSVDFTADDHDFALAIWTDDGAGGLVLDTTFQGDGLATVTFDLTGGPKTDRLRVARPQGSGLWLVGSADGAGGFSHAAVARLDLATGNLDGAFGSGGKATYQYAPLGGPTWNRTRALDAAPRPTGGLVLTGLVRETSTSWIRPMAFAIDGAGLVEPSWGAFGWYVPDLRYPGHPFESTWGDLWGLAVDASGGALLVGELGNPIETDQNRALAIRLSPFGLPDASFSSDGVELYAFEPGGEPCFDGLAPLVLLDDGKLALAGGYTYGHTSGVPRTDLDVLVARIVMDPTLFTDGFESGDTSAWVP